MKPLFSIILIAAIAFCFASCSTNEPAALPEYSFEGTVQSVTETPLSGLTVTLIPREGDNTPVNTQTDTSGKFSTNVKAGFYDLNIAASGYAPISTKIEVSKSNAPVKVTLTGPGSVSGHIVSSQTGAGLANATIFFLRADSNGEPTGNVEFQLKSDEQGDYSHDGLPTGKFVAWISKQGFFTRQTEVVELTGTPQEMARIVSVEAPPSGALRLVLIWGETPLDLDGHLFGPTKDGDTFHAFYNDKNPTPEVQLDVDARKGFGPETITITELVPGTYKYGIYNYDNRGLYVPDCAEKIANSPTIVEVYDAENFIVQFQVTAPLVTADVNRVELFSLDVLTDGYSLSTQNNWSLGPDSEW